MKGTGKLNPAEENALYAAASLLQPDKTVEEVEECL